ARARRRPLGPAARQAALAVRRHPSVHGPLPLPAEIRHRATRGPDGSGRNPRETAGCGPRSRAADAPGGHAAGTGRTLGVADRVVQAPRLPLLSPAAHRVVRQSTRYLNRTFGTLFSPAFAHPFCPPPFPLQLLSHPYVASPHAPTGQISVVTHSRIFSVTQRP